MFLLANNKFSLSESDCRLTADDAVDNSYLLMQRSVDNRTTIKIDMLSCYRGADVITRSQRRLAVAVLLITSADPTTAAVYACSLITRSLPRSTQTIS